MGAALSSANLEGAALRNANLVGAALDGTEFDETVVLPDAQVIGIDEDNQPIDDKYWTPDTDMTRYTDPDHPDFWQPEWVVAEYDSYTVWRWAGQPAPWLDAGYEDWNEWVRDGRPTSPPANAGS